MDWIHVAENRKQLQVCEHSNETSGSIKHRKLPDYKTLSFSRTMLRPLTFHSHMNTPVYHTPTAANPTCQLFSWDSMCFFMAHEQTDRSELFLALATLKYIFFIQSYCIWNIHIIQSAFSTINIKEECLSNMLVNLYKTTWCHTPEDSNLYKDIYFKISMHFYVCDFCNNAISSYHLVPSFCRFFIVLSSTNNIKYQKLAVSLLEQKGGNCLLCWDGHS